MSGGRAVASSWKRVACSTAGLVSQIQFALQGALPQRHDFPWVAEC